MSEFETMLSGCSANSATILPGWGQGRATFGGLVAALMYRAVSLSVPAPRPLRSLTISFVAPVAPGNIAFDVQLLRVGKSASQLLCLAKQDDQTVAVMQVSQGDARDSTISVEPPAAATFAAPEQCVALPFAQGITPDFTGHFNMHWAKGSLPFCGSPEADIGGWIRFKDEVGVANIEHLLALVDGWPPAVLPMFKRPAPISSLSWTLELYGDPSVQKGSDWWHYLARTDIAQEGYAGIGAEMRDAHGNLVAISRQTVSIFA